MQLRHLNKMKSQGLQHDPHHFRCSWQNSSLCLLWSVYSRNCVVYRNCVIQHHHWVSAGKKNTLTCFSFQLYSGKLQWHFWGADKSMLGKMHVPMKFLWVKSNTLSRYAMLLHCVFLGCCNKPVFWSACCTSKFTLPDFLNQWVCAVVYI